MLRKAIAILLESSAAVAAADNPETVTERSQDRVRAIEANGGAAATRAQFEEATADVR